MVANMKLPFCPRCGAKSQLRRVSDKEFDLLCADMRKCKHGVYDHVKPEAAVKAFLWQLGAFVNQHTADNFLACGCPLSGCKHKMFEAALESVGKTG